MKSLNEAHVIDAPATVDGVVAAVRGHERLTPVGGLTKSALVDARLPQLDMTKLAGVVEYDPGEYTITVRAGTRLETIRALLAEQGQHMPFDPPWVDAGATLGGTIAAGAGGSGRQRFGSLRDFLIGVRFVDGQGRLIRGGGKVVKNAAGFDLPKLMVGSRGKLGILVEASLKVFPEPPAYGTLTQGYSDFASVQAAVARLLRSKFDLYALDVSAAPDGASPYVLRARLGGLETTIGPRLEQLAAFLHSQQQTEPSSMARDGIVVDQGPIEVQSWQAQRELVWAHNAAWTIKCACTASLAQSLEQVMTERQLPIQRLYSSGLNSLWLAGDLPLSDLHSLLEASGLSGLVLRDQNPAATLPAPGYPVLGQAIRSPFYTRIEQTIDPQARFRFV